MYFNYWPILVVDDEPDILTVSKIALRGFEHLGVPVKVFAYKSKAEALEVMRENEWKWGSFIVVALIDVVMETDEAGLELCNLIRSDMDNNLTQLYIRTGQAGKYNESEIFKRFEIDGFLKKTDATEERIRSLVKSGINHYLFNWIYHGNFFVLGEWIKTPQTIESLVGFYNTVMPRMNENIKGDASPHVNIDMWYNLLSNTIACGAFTKDLDGAKIAEKLIAKEPTYRNKNGDVLVSDNGFILLKLSTDNGTTGEFMYLFKSKMHVTRAFFNCLATVIRTTKYVWVSAQHRT